MNKLFQIACASIFLFVSNAVFAGTVIQIQNKSDLATISTDGKLARMSMSGDEYVIVDYKKHTVKMVNPQKKQVVLLKADKAPAGKSSGVQTSLKNLGAGITVAGYPTQKYAYSANGKSCGTIYGSKDAYQKQGIKELLEAMKTMMERQRAVLGGLAGMVDDCTLADMNVSEHVSTIGVPMRTEKNGRVDSEVKSIRLDVELPADTFVIPASYQTISMEQQIQNMKQSMKQHQPQIQQMMQQMQQSGRMSPEMMDQMRRMKEMMQQ